MNDPLQRRMYRNDRSTVSTGVYDPQFYGPIKLQSYKIRIMNKICFQI